MERDRRRPDEAEWPLERQLEMIGDAGFDGAGVRFVNSALARDVTGFPRAHGMSWRAQCYPKTVADLEPVIALVHEPGADHVNPRPDIRLTVWPTASRISRAGAAWRPCRPFRFTSRPTATE